MLRTSQKTRYLISCSFSAPKLFQFAESNYRKFTSSKDNYLSTMPKMKTMNKRIRNNQYLLTFYYPIIIEQSSGLSYNPRYIGNIFKNKNLMELRRRFLFRFIAYCVLIVVFNPLNSCRLHLAICVKFPVRNRKFKLKSRTQS